MRSNGARQTSQSVRGLNVLRRAVGPGALSPTQVVLDGGKPGAVRSPRIQGAVQRLRDEVQVDPEVAFVQSGTGLRTRRYASSF